MNFRIKIIQQLMNINERLFFYPRLASFYRKSVRKDKPILIFDVGANKGQSIKFFLELFPDAVIYAFEPNVRLFNYLQQQFGHLINVHLVNKGVSNQTGSLLLQETVTDETSTFEELNYNSKYLKLKSRVLGVDLADVITERYKVDVITLHDFIQAEQISHIDIVKIDTEGHELKCLEGLFGLNSFPVHFIQLEYHNDDMYLNAPSNESINHYLSTKGFQAGQKIKHGFGDFEELIFISKIA